MTFKDIKPKTCGHCGRGYVRAFSLATLCFDCEETGHNSKLFNRCELCVKIKKDKSEMENSNDEKLKEAGKNFAPELAFKMKDGKTFKMTLSSPPPELRIPVPQFGLNTPVLFVRQENGEYLQTDDKSAA